MDALLIFQSTPGELMPISGYALCFIPLAAVIIGFIIAARYTDRQATATYLRVLPASEAAGSGGAVTGAEANAQGRPFLSFLGNERPVSAPTPQNPTYEEMIPPIPRVVASTPLAPVLATPVVAGVQPGVSGSNTAPVKTQAKAQSSTPVVAARADVGITRVGWDAPGRDKVDEYVQIENPTNGAVDMTGWQLSDDTHEHSFSFPIFVLAAHSHVRVWSGSGASDANNLYMQSATPVWNIAGGTATLRNAKGDLVSHWSYEARKRA